MELGIISGYITRQMLHRPAKHTGVSYVTSTNVEVDSRTTARPEI